MRVQIKGSKICLHMNEYVMESTAVDMIKSMQESFTYSSTHNSLVCKCPCSKIDGRGNFTDKPCGQIIVINYVLGQLPLKIINELKNNIEATLNRAKRDHIFKQYRYATECPVCVNPKYYEGIGFPLIDGFGDDEELADNKINCRECNTCGEIWCALCGGLYFTSNTPHDFITCNQLDRLNVDISAKLVSKISTKCPKCGANIQRITGCNHITCRCGADFCYKCGNNLKYIKDSEEYYCSVCKEYN